MSVRQSEHAMVQFADEVTRSVKERFPGAQVRWQRDDRPHYTFLYLDISLLAGGRQRDFSRIFTSLDIADANGNLAESFLKDTFSELE